MVPVHVRDWVAPARLPYRKTYRLTAGQHWSQAPTTDAQWEHYAVLPDGQPVPVGSSLCGSLWWTAQTPGGQRLSPRGPAGHLSDLSAYRDDLAHMLRPPFRCNVSVESSARSREADQEGEKDGAHIRSPGIHQNSVWRTVRCML